MATKDKSFFEEKLWQIISVDIFPPTGEILSFDANDRSC